MPYRKPDDKHQAVASRVGLSAGDLRTLELIQLRGANGHPIASVELPGVEGIPLDVAREV